MNNKDKNRELLSRRDFFKKTAKATLPFIAAMALPPFLSNCGDKEEDPINSGCDGCSSTCEGICQESCSIGCKESCVNNSKGSSSCSDCSANCSSNCKEECNSTCQNGAKKDDNSENKDNYTAVDLGLSVLWATHDFGATQSTEYSPTYDWGRKDGESYSDWKTWLNEGIYNISGTERDIVRATWGGNWRLPTESEIRELAELCTYTYEKRNGILGVNIKGNNGNSIFLSVRKNTVEKDWGSFMTGKRTSNGTVLLLSFSCSKKEIGRDVGTIDISFNIRPVKDGGSGCKDCSNGCSSGCYTSCENSAKNSDGGGGSSGGDNNSGCATCENTCNSGCGGGCYYSCGGSCSNNCQGNCRFSCIGWSMSVKNCSSTCYGTCNNQCDETCKSYCYTTCQNVGKQS